MTNFWNQLNIKASNLDENYAVLKFEFLVLNHSHPTRSEINESIIIPDNSREL